MSLYNPELNPVVTLCVLNSTEILPGDVLLGFSPETAEDLKSATGCSYSHAAICTAPSQVADCNDQGVRQLALGKLQEEYSHFVAFRQPFWTKCRVKELGEFVSSSLVAGASFNRKGFARFKPNRIKHKQNIQQYFEAFFDGSRQPLEVAKPYYFCSEFVAAAFVAVGIIQPSAAILLDPAVTSPGHLAQEPAYGLFAGYLKPYAGYQIPDDDDFVHETPIHEIHGQT